MNNSVIYARVSTEKQATKGFSLPTQIDECKKYAKNAGHSVQAVFQDKYTGTVLDRPGLEKLKQFVSTEEIDTVIVYDIDRLARKAIHQMLIEEELLESGNEIEYVLGRYQDTDEGRLQKQIRASISEYERAKILERMKRGKRGKAKSGSVIVGSRPPHGYETKQEGKRKWFVINQEEARIVKLVFDWYTNGYDHGSTLSQIGIASKLTEMKVLTRGDMEDHVAKKLPRYAWQSATIHRFLTRKAYAGTWFYGKTMMKNGKQVPRAQDEWIPVQVPQIIDIATFDTAQEKLKINKEQSTRSTKHNYLMGRRLKCAKCNYSFVGRTRREKNQYYYCKGKEQRPTSRCDISQFRADLVNETVWSWVEELLLDPDALRDGLNAYLKNSKELEKSNYDQVETLTKQITKTEMKLDKLIDLYLEDQLTKESLLTKRISLEDALKTLRVERSELRSNLHF